MKKFILLSSFILLTQYDVSAGIKTTFDDFLYETKVRVNYYKPYAIVGSLSAVGLSSNKLIGTFFLAAAGVYSLYSWQTGFFEIRALRHKYKRLAKPKDHWSDKLQEEKPFLFCRWRQQDDQFGDGVYWPTAWWMTEHRNDVIRTLVKDIYSNRIILVDENKKIEIPTPDQVLRAMNREIRELEQDKETLKQYTDVYRKLSSAEEFKPNKSYWRVFWPNYNHASRLYIDIVSMLKRLEVLREIISNMKLSTGGHGWAQLR